jgi:hypothetical protein
LRLSFSSNLFRSSDSRVQGDLALYQFYRSSPVSVSCRQICNRAMVMTPAAKQRGQGFERSSSSCADRRSFVAPEAYGVSIEPVAGHYRTKLVSGGHPVGIRIWHGPPLDPETGDEMDRSHRWQAHCNDQYIDIDRVWPGCGGDPINRPEYEYLTSVQEWGKENAPNSPQANPRQRINFLTAPIPI